MPKLVNMVPGEGSVGITPAGPIHVGIKSTSESMHVYLGETRVDFATTTVGFNGLLPEDDEDLLRSADVSVETIERVRPVAGQSSATVTSDSMLIARTSSANDLCIYEVAVPVVPGESVMAHFKIRRRAWTTGARQWAAGLPNLTGVYLGLEYGPRNTGGYLFLQDDGGSGSFIVGGPLQALNSPRPFQNGTDYFDWKGSTPIGEEIEVWLLFNELGENPSSEGVPTSVPIFEVLARSPLEPDPVSIAAIPVGELGTYPLTLGGAYNARQGHESIARVFFGIDGTSGDVLEVVDWALYPNYRQLVQEGRGLPGCSLQVLPDAPVTYSAGDGRLPSQHRPCRWMPAGPTPNESFGYAPGRNGRPFAVRMTRNSTAPEALKKDEPIIGRRNAGAAVEAVIYGQTKGGSKQTGMGIAIEDGQKAYRALLVPAGASDAPTIGMQGFVPAHPDTLLVTTAANADGSTYSIDWTAPHLVRLAVDRVNGKAYLDVDQKPLLAVDLSTGEFPAAENARVLFGHLLDTSSMTVSPFESSFFLSKVSYLPKYYAWEGDLGLLPNTIPAAARFSLQATTGASSLAAGVLSILKGTAGPGLYRKYLWSPGTPVVDGFQVDFTARVKTYADRDGRTFGPNSSVGAGVDLSLGTKKVSVRFLDCGIHGRKIAIIPEGGVAEVIAQTTVGRAFSTDLDWTQSNLIRLVYRKHGSVELYVGSVMSPPKIVIPWRNDTDGFALPLDNTAPGVVFGHMDEDTTSTTEWEFFRWGLSNGYELFAEGPSEDLADPRSFGGRAFVRIQSNES